MKKLQEKYGKDRLAVLMLSVDEAYGTPTQEAIEGNRAVLREHQITWQNVVVPGGWEEMEKRFGIDGYGITYVDAKGNLIGMDLTPEMIDVLLHE